MFTVLFYWGHFLRGDGVGTDRLRLSSLVAEDAANDSKLLLPSLLLAPPFAKRKQTCSKLMPAMGTNIELPACETIARRRRGFKPTSPRSIEKEHVSPHALSAW